MTGIYSVSQKRKIIEGLALGCSMNLSTYNYFSVATDIYKEKIIEGLARGFSMDLSAYNYFLVTTDICCGKREK